MLKILKRLMTTFDVPLPLANSIYNLSLTVLIGGSVLVLFSALALLWSGMIKDRHATEDTTKLQSAANQASATLEKTKAELTETTKQLADAKAAVAAALKSAKGTPSAAIEKPRAPGSYREITPEAREQFVTFVKTFAKGKVFLDWVGANPEATDYAGQISDLLKEAGYTVDVKSTSTTTVADAPIGVQMKIKNIYTQPSYAGTLQRGLEYISINPTGELDDAAEDAVLIFVGNKP